MNASNTLLGKDDALVHDSPRRRDGGPNADTYPIGVELTGWKAGVFPGHSRGRDPKMNVPRERLDLAAAEVVPGVKLPYLSRDGARAARRIKR